MLHADNCVEQNKNTANIHYLMWRTLTGRHKAATLSFMLVGHTKFAPDCFFGLFKRCFIRSSVCTMFYIRPEPIMLQKLPIILLGISPQNYLLFSQLHPIILILFL